MRPVRLELEGFTAFRDPVTIDFEGADLFAITGPTGAGKSSIIDGLVFALYGCIPRLDRRAVEPVIALGQTEARVDLHFTVGGEAYEAVRVVRRTKAGASTREARLERKADGEVLAGTAAEVTSAVTELLGLDFDHFTTCVVLPQGQFARLLHVEPRTRQDLLVSLLDLGVFARMATAARHRASVARGRAEVAARLLGKLAFATPAAKAAAETRLHALEALRAEVVAARPAIEGLERSEREASAEAETAAQRARLLAQITEPADLGGRTDALAAAREDVERLAAAEAEAQRAFDAAEAAFAALPTAADLQAVERAHAEQADLLGRRAEAEARLGQCRVAEAAAEADHTAAEQHLAAADARLERARWEHRAHDLAGSLVAGEDCPVCRQAVHEVPDLDGAVAAEAVDAASAARADTAAHLARAVGARREAEQAHTKAENRLASIRERLAAIEAALAAAPDPAEVAARLVEVAAADTARHAARRADRAARAGTTAARAELDRLVAAEAADRRRFADERDRVAALGPPPPGHDDLAADWQALAAWAADARPEQQAAAEAAEARAAAAAQERAARADDLTERCKAAGVERAGDDLFQAVAEAVAEARASVATVASAMEEAADHRREVSEQGRSADIATALATHLSADHFEKWVLDEAVGALVAAATEVLFDLSGGDYSLALDQRANFLVVDHRCADEVRSARTLSGGETFLASLALALALADQIGALAADGAARLESIFLDEGFGSLDPETLDTVAAAIEELGARGRTVGLITHVADLGERVPVRFVVDKGPGSSTVTRLVA